MRKEFTPIKIKNVLEREILEEGNRIFRLVRCVHGDDDIFDFQHLPYVDGHGV